MIFGCFLVLQMWLYMQYFAFDNCILGDISGGAAAAKFDGIAVKDFAEFVVLSELFSDKL